MTRKNLTNIREIYETMRSYFNDHFYNDNSQTVFNFIGQSRKLLKSLKDEVVKKIFKRLDNSRKTDPDTSRVSEI